MNKEMEELIFSLVREETPVSLVSKDGVKRRYIVREMDGRDRDSYLTKMGNKMKLGADGKVIGITSFDGLQAALLCLCLFDEEDKAVPIKDIQEYPAKVQSELFKIAQTINGLDKDEENPKKD